MSPKNHQSRVFKPAQPAVALIALNATAKLSIGKEADKLPEDSAPLIHAPLCAVRAAQTCLAAVKSRQTKNSLNSLPIHHLPTSLSALAGQQ